MGSTTGPPTARATPRRRFGLLVALAAWGVCAIASAAPADFKRFFGVYEGESVTQIQGGIEKRDIRAEIGPQGNGFRVKWTLVIRRPSGKVKRTEETINFLPTRRDHLFSSAIRTDAFGNAVPLDPLKGDLPGYVWAQIRGETLTIYALILDDDGGFEIQTYDRTLKPGGLELRYNSIVDGQPQRTITGMLKKIR